MLEPLSICNNVMGFRLIYVVTAMLGPMYNNNNIWPYILRIHNAATSKHPRSFDEIEDEWIYSWRRPIYDVKQD